MVQRTPRESPPGTTTAVWSLILGLVSLPLTCLCGVGILVAVPAVVLGWRAKDVPGSRGMAVGGIVAGALSIALSISFVVALATGAIDRPRA